MTSRRIKHIELALQGGGAHGAFTWGLYYDQPIVLNERQAGVAVEGVEQHNRAEDRIRRARCWPWIPMVSRTWR